MQTVEGSETDRPKPQPRLDDETLLTSSHVGKRYGDVTTMSLWRWVNDEKLAFPKPEKINGRNYWRLGRLREWDATRSIP